MTVENGEWRIVYQTNVAMNKTNHFYGSLDTSLIKPYQNTINSHFQHSFTLKRNLNSKERHCFVNQIKAHMFPFPFECNP